MKHKIHLSKLCSLYTGIDLLTANIMFTSDKTSQISLNLLQVMTKSRAALENWRSTFDNTKIKIINL